MKKFIEIPIEKLKKAHWNYKEEDPWLQEQLVNNIKENDQIENIIVREEEDGSFEVVNGNHRLDAFKTLKFKTVMCCNLGKISQAHAEKIAIETNEFKFKTNNIKLAKLLEEVKAEFSVDDLLKTMPYKDTELENFSDMLKFTWDAPKIEADELTQPVAHNAEPQKPVTQNESSGGSLGPSVTHNLPDNRIINLKLSSDIAEEFEAQLRRIKKLLYPEQIPEHVALDLPIQAMLQIIAETDDSRFS